MEACGRGGPAERGREGALAGTEPDEVCLGKVCRKAAFLGAWGILEPKPCIGCGRAANKAQALDNKKATMTDHGGFSGPASARRGGHWHVACYRLTA